MGARVYWTFGGWEGILALSVIQESPVGIWSLVLALTLICWMTLGKAFPFQSCFPNL